MGGGRGGDQRPAPTRMRPLKEFMLRRRLLGEGGAAGEVYSAKAAWPEALAWSRASASPFTPTLQIWHRSVKVAVSVNCLSFCACSPPHRRPSQIG